MKEIWKNIEGYEGYQISNLGRVKSLKFGKERILKPNKDKDKYLIVCLCKQGIKKMCKVHRLVASAFIENPNNFCELNHRDECKANNCVSNLEWCDRKHNINYGTRNQRAAASRINHPKRSKQVMCVETGIIYPSTIEAARQLGFSQGNISSCCNGRHKTCGGYTWQYVS